MNKFKNKTLATFLASGLGSVGIHRFYVCGYKDRGGWLHFLSLPVSGLLLLTTSMPAFFAFMPLILSTLIGFIEALVIGLTPDEKWDKLHNHRSQLNSRSDWPLAVLLVLTLGIGAIALIACISRFIDLILTGGALG